MHKFVHIEIPCGDLRRAKAWYEKVFGWTFQDFDKNYSLIFSGGENIGGLYKSAKPIPRPDRKRPGVRAYVQVEDLDAKLKEIRKARGSVTEEKQEVPGMGWWAGFADPQGCMLYLWQRDERGAQPAMEHQVTAMNTALDGRKVSEEAALLKT